MTLGRTKGHGGCMKQLGQDFYFYVMKEFSGVSLMRLIGIRNEVSDMGHTKGARMVPPRHPQGNGTHELMVHKKTKGRLFLEPLYGLFPRFIHGVKRKWIWPVSCVAAMEDVKISISIVFSQEAVFNHKAASFLGSISSQERHCGARNRLRN